jgi:hypothetical protein
MGFDGSAAECDRCGDWDGAEVMAEVEGVGVLCWKCARDLGLFVVDPFDDVTLRRVWLRRVRQRLESVTRAK